MEKLIKSRLILETRTTLDKTFAEIQTLKQMNITDESACIKHTDNIELPAGCYDDYDSFMRCYYIVLNVKYDADEATFKESVADAKNAILDEMIGMSEEARFHALVRWDIIMKQTYEKHRGMNGMLEQPKVTYVP